LRLTIITALLFPTFLLAQTNTTSGQCSPITPNNGGTITINCQGIPARLQGQILELLNRIAKDQTTAEAILAKVDTCIAQSAPRSITDPQRLAANLRIPAGRDPFHVSIRATNSTSESQNYAEQIRNVFVQAKWDATPVFYNMVAGAPVPPGISVFAQGPNSIAGALLQLAFQQSGIPAEYGSDPSLPTDTIVMVVGQKPVQ
jgi:hypothetical protein